MSEDEKKDLTIKKFLEEAEELMDKYNMITEVSVITTKTTIRITKPENNEPDSTKD